MLKPIQFTVPVYGEGIFTLLEEKKQNFYNYYHRHKELQLTYIFKGRGTLMVGNRVQSFQEDDVFLLLPNDAHMLDGAADKDRNEGEVHALHIFIDMERMGRLLVIPEFDVLERYFAELDASKKIFANISAQLKVFFENLMRTAGIPKFMQLIELLHVLALHKAEAASLYTGMPSLSYTDRDGERISDVYKYTFDHFHEDIAIEDVAAIVHMTSTSFCKFFKKHSMKTYIGFLNEVRIEKACQLLMNSKVETIAEVAFQVGFNNVIHFNRVFKQVAKLSPSRYLKEYRF